MPKAMLVLLGLAAIGAGVLQMRQRSLALRYEAGQLHRQIQRSQATLWRQQLDIAAYTSPQVIQSMAGGPRRSEASAKDMDAARE